MAFCFWVERTVWRSVWTYGNANRAELGGSGMICEMAKVLEYLGWNELREWAKHSVIARQWSCHVGFQITESVIAVFVFFFAGWRHR